MVLHSSYLHCQTTHILFRNFIVLWHVYGDLSSELDNCVVSECIRASSTRHMLLHQHWNCFSNEHNLLYRDAVNCLKTRHTPNWSSVLPYGKDTFEKLEVPRLLLVSRRRARDIIQFKTPSGLVNMGPSLSFMNNYVEVCPEMLAM